MDSTDTTSDDVRTKDMHPEDTGGLSDWAGIQSYVADNDVERIKGYSEDVDNLLLFAALFSAILTAFVVDTYQQLLPSGEEATNQFLATNNELLVATHRLLIQGFSAVFTQTSFVPSTPLVLESKPQFASDPAARWINSLFFVSLILSLAAALFGILIKQWLRHYMTWNSPLSPPRENVLVRQFRLEAWELWDVTIVVSMALALLEVAMTLFLVGIIILLWTLDSIVAICVTVASSVFLLAQAVVTVLPVVFRRCPYRTPAAWTLVLIYNFATRSASYFFRRMHERWSLVRSRWNYLRASNPPGTGTAEHSSHRDSGISQGNTAEEGSLHRVPVVSQGQGGAGNSLHRSSGASSEKAVAVSSGNSAAEDHSSPASSASSGNTGRNDPLSCIYRLFSTHWEHCEKKECRPLTPTSPLLFGMSWRTLDLQSCRAVHRAQRPDFVEQVLATTIRIAERIIREFAPLPKDLSDYRDMTALLSDAVSKSHVSYDSFLEELSEMSFLIGALFWVKQSAQDPHVTRYIEQCSRMELRYHQDTLKWFLKAFSPRGPFSQDASDTVKKLRLFLLQFVLCGIGYPVTSGMQFVAYRDVVQTYRIGFSALDRRLVISEGRTRDEDFESLLLHYFEAHFEHANEDRLRMFILTATKWLAGHRISSVSRDVMDGILRKMVRAAEALAKGPKQDTGASAQFPYLQWIWGLAAEKELLASEHGAQYRLLLHALEEAYVTHMFSFDGRHIRRSLHVQLRAAHQSLAGSECETSHCEWATHDKCMGKPRNHYHGCPLLEQRELGTAQWRRARLVVFTVLQLRRISFHAHPRWRRAVLTVRILIHLQRRAASRGSAAGGSPNPDHSTTKSYRLCFRSCIPRDQNPV